MAPNGNVTLEPFSEASKTATDDADSSTSSQSNSSGRHGEASSVEERSIRAAEDSLARASRGRLRHAQAYAGAQ